MGLSLAVPALLHTLLLHCHWLVSHALVRKGPVTYMPCIDPVYTKLPLQNPNVNQPCSHLYLLTHLFSPLFKHHLGGNLAYSGHHFCVPSVVPCRPPHGLFSLHLLVHFFSILYTTKAICLGCTSASCHNQRLLLAIVGGKIIHCTARLYSTALGPTAIPHSLWYFPIIFGPWNPWELLAIHNPGQIFED